MQYVVKVLDGFGKPGWLNKNRKQSKPETYLSLRAAEYAVRMYSRMNPRSVSFIQQQREGTTAC